MSKINEEEALVKAYDSKLMKRLLKYAMPFKWHLLVVILLMFVGTGLDLLRPMLIKNAIDNDINGYKKAYTIVQTPVEGSIKIDGSYVVKGENKSGKPASMVYYNKKYYIIDSKIKENGSFTLNVDKFMQDGNVYNAYQLSDEQIKVLRASDISDLINTVMYTLLICVGVFILGYLAFYILQKTGQRIIFNIRSDLFKKVEGLSLSFYDKNPVGRLVTRVTNDVEALNEMYTGVLVYLFKDIFILSGILIAIFSLNVKLALIILGSVPFVIIGSAVFKKYDREAYREVRAKLARINSSLSENISGMKTVQIYHVEDKMFNKFDEINKSYFKSSMKQLTIFALFRPSVDLVSTLTLAVLLWFGGVKVLNQEIAVGVLFAFVSYLMQFFQPIFDLTEKYDILQSSMASAERIFMLMDNQSEIKNSDTPVSITRLKGEIEFKNVWFAYNEEQWVLRDVSFKINKGEKIAFVGATGAGKTSIISLISRLYDIQKGEILIDGINIKDMNQYDLRKNLATVLQDVFLFTGDIKSNVRLNEADITDEDVIKACKYVNADKFIEKLPNKYDDIVNERGTTFSQGERQLIAFARAIAFNPPILVLDEATSNIDTETESLIQDALEKITKGRTTIIVAHRLSTIKNADKIIVLHKGKIRECGNHEELLSKEGLYYNLYKLQYKEMENPA
ncbi:ABC transporter, ATP-binding protein [Clostridiales bacterium oral taxon 876 str. F0540]|nr:ABC transporter, ATP-binding protein [Clostridiales bacterium oral taxon 876 str. F0540]